jgi:hypothetical protein
MNPSTRRGAIFRAESVNVLSVPDFAGEYCLHALELRFPSRHFNLVAFMQVQFCHFCELRGGQMDFDGAAGGQPHDDVRTNSSADRALAVSHVFDRSCINCFGGALLGGLCVNAGIAKTNRKIPIRSFMVFPLLGPLSGLIE